MKVRRPSGFWSSKENQRNFLDSVKNELNVKNLADWSKLSHSNISALGGRTLLTKYGESIHLMLKEVYPEHSFDFMRHYWDIEENQVTLMDRIATKLGYKQLEDWYQITEAQVITFGGKTLLRKFHSTFDMLQHVYPKHEWLPWKFHHMKKKYWDDHWDKNQVKKLIDWLYNELHLRDIQDWYRVSGKEVLRLLPTSLLESWSLSELLTRAYPLHRFDASLLNPSRLSCRKSSQRLVHSFLKERFPESIEEYALLRDPVDNRIVPVDVYIPNKKLAVEYQGEQHYQDIYAMGSRFSQMQRDQAKATALSRLGISLLVVPYWWDRRGPTLFGKLREIRPDMVPEDTGETIPAGNPKIPEAVSLMHGQDWDPRMDLKGFYLTEKFDGIRAHWDGIQLTS